MEGVTDMGVCEMNRVWLMVAGPSVRVWHLECDI